MNGERFLVVAQVTLIVMLAAGLLTAVYRFVTFCLTDLDQAIAVRYLPRETWRLLILIVIPVGGILYLLYGRIS